jgi:hypothetical protein
MESLDELSKTNGKGFFKHVFNFNDESKSEIMNIVQYAVLALVPVVIMNKAMQRFVPEADEDKGNFELLGEVVLQVVVMFMGILLIHRIVTYVPTYSGEKYIDFSVTNIILATLVIVLSLQTKLGEKVSILVDRVVQLWEGQDPKRKQSKGKGNVKVSQPISQNQMAMNQSLNTMGSTSVASLPPVTQQLPNYDSMHQENTTPLVGAATPGMGMETFEPMAANAGGGGAFGNAFW